MDSFSPKTKIVATVGPSTDKKEIIENLVEEGVDIFRFNFSHADYGFFEKIIGYIRDIEKSKGRPIAIMADLQGPRVRISSLYRDPLDIKMGEEYGIAGRGRAEEPREIILNYPHITHEVKRGDRILIDDGTLIFEVFDVTEKKVLAKAMRNGKLRLNKGVNVPGRLNSLPVLTEKDIHDLGFSTEHHFDFIALSFVREGINIDEARKHLGKTNPWILAKIECKKAILNIEEILERSDGVIVARGDLGVEISLKEVPLVQKRLINLARVFGKPVIIATQILESMVHNPYPTRAEVSDIANAIIDGADALMVSEETAIGEYPVEVVKILVEVASVVEDSLPPYERINFREKPVEGTIAGAGVEAASQLDAKVLVAFTYTGATARYLSRMRPRMPILAVTPREDTWRKLPLLFGVTPSLVKEKIDSTDEIFERAVEEVRKFVPTKRGDIVVTVAGIPLFVPGTTNLLKVSKIK
jgi:pyruvate kinase